MGCALAQHDRKVALHGGVGAGVDTRAAPKLPAPQGQYRENGRARALTAETFAPRPGEAKEPEFGPDRREAIRWRPLVTERSDERRQAERPPFARNVNGEWGVEPDMRTGELADRLGINTKTIRYYESIGLLPAAQRTSSGYRHYGAADVDQLSFINRAQRLAMRLDQIREILALRDRGEAPYGYVREVLDHQVTQIDQRIAELAGLREQLVALQARAQQLPTADAGCFCGIIEDASILLPRPTPPRGRGLPRSDRPPRSAR